MKDKHAGQRLLIAAHMPDSDTFTPLGYLSLDGGALKMQPEKGKGAALRRFIAFYRSRGAGIGMDDATFLRTLPSRISYQSGSCAWVDSDAQSE